MKKPKQNLKAIALARIEIVKFVLMRQKIQDFTLRQAILAFCEKSRARCVPPHIIDAILIANARPSKTDSTNVSVKTLYEWVRLYKLDPNDTNLLRPRPSKISKFNKMRLKMVYQMENRKQRKKKRYLANDNEANK